MDLMMNGQPLDLSGNGFASPFVFVELGQTYSYLLPHSRFPVMKSNRLWIANLLPGPRYASLRWVRAVMGLGLAALPMIWTSSVSFGPHLTRGRLSAPVRGTGPDEHTLL